VERERERRKRGNERREMDERKSGRRK